MTEKTNPWEGMTDAQRIQQMQDNADNIEETTYYRRLSGDEVSERRVLYTDKSIELVALEEQLDIHKKVYKGKIDPLKKEKQFLLTTIHSQQEQTKGNLYHFNNFEKGVVETYDEKGELHAVRKMRPDEKKGQPNVFAITKAS